MSNPLHNSNYEADDDNNMSDIVPDNANLNNLSDNANLNNLSDDANLNILSDNSNLNNSRPVANSRWDDLILAPAELALKAKFRAHNTNLPLYCFFKEGCPPGKTTTIKKPIHFMNVRDQKNLCFQIKSMN